MNKVKTNLFKEFCLETYNLILSKFNNVDLKWISITPTVHSLLAHGWELISFNDDKGLHTRLEGVKKNLQLTKDGTWWVLKSTFQG